MATITKGFIAKSDFSLWDGKNATFSRNTVTGGSESLNRVDWAGVDILQVYGSGSSRTKATIDTALSAIGTTNAVQVFLSPGTWTIDADADYSSYTNIMWCLPAGVSFSISSGVTLTLYSSKNVLAGIQQAIATGDGELSFSNYGTSLSGIIDEVVEDAYINIRDFNLELIHQFPSEFIGQMSETMGFY